jgi:CrcB protein
MVRNFILVGLGGMIGSVLRYLAALLIKNPVFPVSTFIVNFAGSFVIGAIMGISLKNQWFNQNWRIFLATGVCGGFTTFSTFSLECVQLLQQQRYSVFAAYTFFSIAAGTAAAFAGFWLTTYLK